MQKPCGIAVLSTNSATQAGLRALPPHRQFHLAAAPALSAYPSLLGGGDPSWSLDALAQTQEFPTPVYSSTICRPISPNLEASPSPPRHVLCPRQGAALRLSYAAIGILFTCWPAGQDAYAHHRYRRDGNGFPAFVRFRPARRKFLVGRRRLPQGASHRPGPALSLRTGQTLLPPETWANLVVRPHAIEDAGTTLYRTVQSLTPKELPIPPEGARGRGKNRLVDAPVAGRCSGGPAEKTLLPSCLRLFCFGARRPTQPAFIVGFTHRARPPSPNPNPSPLVYGRLSVLANQPAAHTCLFTLSQCSRPRPAKTLSISAISLSAFSIDAFRLPSPCQR